MRFFLGHDGGGSVAVGSFVSCWAVRSCKGFGSRIPAGMVGVLCL